MFFDDLLYHGFILPHILIEEIVLRPNARCQAPLEAGARQERTLAAGGCTPLIRLEAPAAASPGVCGEWAAQSPDRSVSALVAQAASEPQEVWGAATSARRQQTAITSDHATDG
jgi:hypothetical protein